jgi:effector-binding domain-containing protein
MFTNGGAAALVMVGLMTLMARGADGSPATQPAETWHLSGLVVKEVREVPGFLGDSTRTTLRTLPAALGQVFQPIMAKAKESHVEGMGPAIFVYRGATGDPDQEFVLETGFAVPADTKDAGDLKVKKLPAILAATAYYTGPVAHMGEACGQLYAQIAAGGYTPTQQMREVYLWWEGPDSPNNVVELQVEIRKPPEAPSPKP